MDILKCDFLEKVLTGRKLGCIGSGCAADTNPKVAPTLSGLQFPHQHSKKLVYGMSLKVLISVTKKAGGGEWVGVEIR